MWANSSQLSLIRNSNCIQTHAQWIAAHSIPSRLFLHALSLYTTLEHCSGIRLAHSENVSQSIRQKQFKFFAIALAACLSSSSVIISWVWFIALCALSSPLWTRYFNSNHLKWETVTHWHHLEVQKCATQWHYMSKAEKRHCAQSNLNQKSSTTCEYIRIRTNS